MHFTKAILIVIPCECTLAMMNHGMGIAPSFQPSVDVVLVGINERARDKSLGSLWIAGSCSQNAFNEAFKERFAPFSHVMHEFKKAQI